MGATLSQVRRMRVLVGRESYWSDLSLLVSPKSLEVTWDIFFPHSFRMGVGNRAYRRDSLGIAAWTRGR